MKFYCNLPRFRCREHCQNHCYREDGSLIFDHEFLCEEQHAIEDKNVEGNISWTF